MSKEEFEEFLEREGWERDRVGADWAYLQNYADYIWDTIYIEQSYEDLVTYIYNDSEDKDTFNTFELFIEFYKNRWL